MIAPPIPYNEQARLAALRKLALLDSEREDRFDRFTSLAARVFDVPIAQINLIDEHRQWIKSCFGADMKETERSTSFCAHTVGLGEPLIILDAARDPRFCDNPYVVGDPKVRFYAGFPIWSEETDLMVGTLCVVDTRPRLFSEADRKSLRDLSELVRQEFKNCARELQMESEERLNTLLTYSASGFFDDHFKVSTCYFSPRWKEILGYADAELPNHYETFRQLVHRDDFGHVREMLAPVAPGIRPFSFECRMRHKEGHWIWIESRGVVTADNQLETMRHLGFIVDITERRRNSERLRVLELCMERLPQGVMIADAQFAPASLSIIDVNPAFERITGYSREELIGIDPCLLKGPYPDEVSLLREAYLEQRPVTFEGESMRKDGTPFQGSWTVSPLPDAEGRLTYLVTSLREADSPALISADFGQFAD